MKHLPLISSGYTWIDSHCHLQPGRDEPAVARAVDAGVGRMVCIGTDLATSRQAVELAGAHPNVWATVGLHPHDASRFAQEWDGLVELARSERVVGVGESGFDLHYRHSLEEDQEKSFRAHVRLAAALDLALVVHSRDAWPQTFAVLETEGVCPRALRTVFHCFTGGPEEARRALGLGAWISFSGIVSFPDAGEVRAAAAATPGDRLLVETDSPFLAPVPHRGKRNEPAHLPVVGAAVAAARGSSAEAVADATRANALTVFWP